MTQTTGLALYDRTAAEGSVRLIRAYSTSFGLASRLCSPEIRGRLADVYALVRVADEIVDGPAAEAGLDPAARREVLDDLERETEHALDCGYSSNLVVHAFARTARASGIRRELTRPFFASMRRDLSPLAFADEAELDEYVYGSAEVVGLMCLSSFSVGLPADPDRDARWQHGARHLGSAFQRVNFLRDLAADYRELGRSYFPGIDPARFTEADKARILDGIDDDLRIAGATIPDLPAGCRRAVFAAHALFGELAAVLRRTPAAELLTRRVRVHPARKAVLLAHAATRTGSARTGPARTGSAR